MTRISREAASKLNVCQYCEGYGRHSCTFFKCSPAAREAERQYRKERKLYMEAEYKESSERKYYGRTIGEALHEVLGIRMDEDIDSIRRKYSLDEILDAVLVYEGILGYSSKLMHVVEEIFGIDLLKLDV